MAYSRSTARIHVKTNTRARRVNHARLAHDVMEMAGESRALPLASCRVGCRSPKRPGNALMPTVGRARNHPPARGFAAPAHTRRAGKR